MLKRFLKVFAIILTALFFIDWFLGVLRFSVKEAQTVLEVLNVPFGIIALRLEQTVPPMTDTPQIEILTVPVFLAMVFLQALLYTGILFAAKKLLSKEKVRTALRRIPH
jgi:ABC-type Na+ efflux pump permease subunit